MTRPRGGRTVEGASGRLPVPVAEGAIMSAPILAAFDPLREDRAPVELALAVWDLTGAAVLVAAVSPAVLVAGDVAELRDTGLQDAADAALARVGGIAGVETRMLYDVSVPRALHVLAEHERAGLIVVGSTRRGAFGRVLPGSTAERLLHGSQCPVALAPRGYTRSSIDTVAVGFIDTPEGHAALAAAELFARRAHARLRVVTVLQPAGALDAARAAGVPPARAQALEGRHRAERKAAMTRAIAALPEGVPIEPEVHVDDAADVLLAISEHADLIVCGSRGYGPLRSVLLGGVSRRLVDGAHCPVLVLPRGVEQSIADLLRTPASGAVVG
jgi:nucleotide-binding universal stress UspA family protein